LALTGDFHDIRFAELIQRFALSKETVAVSIHLAGGDREADGVFHFDGGELVAGRLSGTEGAEALRRALRLRDGTFRVEVGARAPEGSAQVRWADIVLEELVELDGEDRGRRAASRPRAPPWPPPLAAPAPAFPAAPPVGRRGGRSVAWLALLAVAGAAALTIVTMVLILLSPAARRADHAVEALLEPRPPAPRTVGDAEILLGMAGPLTGANRELGRGMRAGLEAAFGEANAGGGVHGRKLRLVVADDGYEPSRTGPALAELVVQKQVFAIVGNVGTPTAAVAVPYCVENKVLFFGAYTGGDLLRKEPPERYVFNFRPSYADEAAAAVRWLVHKRRVNPQRIAVFAQEDEFGAAGWRGVMRQLGSCGVEAGSVLRVGYRRNTEDVARAVATVRERAADIDAVVMVATYRAAAAFIRETQAAGLALRYTNVSAADSTALGGSLAASGARAPREVLVTQVVPPLSSSRSPMELRYLAALERYVPGERPGAVSLEGFVVGSLLVEGFRRAGRGVDTEKLVAALEGIRDLDLGLGTRLAFSPGEHQASRRVWGSVIQPDGTSRATDLE
jgi:ABC-type branched-subunit amino acid transport system substrate-binding protein